MTTRRDDQFAEALRTGLAETRRDTADLRDSPAFREFEDTAASVIAAEREQAARPWRRLSFWLLAGYALMIVLSVVQFAMWMNR